MYGFYRVAAAVPQVQIANVDFNVGEIKSLYTSASTAGAAAVVFPEMCITGYTAGDLFFQPGLLRAAVNGVLQIAGFTADKAAVAIVGAPLVFENQLYNCAFVLQAGQIIGIVPKQLLPNYQEFGEKRYFRSGAEIVGREVEIDGKMVPFGTDLIFQGSDGFIFGIEICEDLWGVMPPSSALALGGATVIFNPAACNEHAGKADARRKMIAALSKRLLGAYVFASAGVGESTTDAVYAGDAIIAANGEIRAENPRFNWDNALIFSDIDLEYLNYARRCNSSFYDNPGGRSFRKLTLPMAVNGSPDWKYASIKAAPMLFDEREKLERCTEVLNIQATGLARRFQRAHSKRMIIGVSGGLDSTLALLVAHQAVTMLDLPMDTIQAFTMPGFGTTSRTRNNSERLCETLGIPVRTIDITAACLQHFDDIGHDPADLNTAYENVQARERTQILMDIANEQNGLVVGTGDLSEIALGWSTYNGDHMSMYAVNSSVPKTLIQDMVRVLAEHKYSGETARVLLDIADTPISPELLPPDKSGKIEQKTEDIIGPYELHDFFLYYMVIEHAAPEKIYALACEVWQQKYPKEVIKKTLQTFMRRFFQQQFKRSCMPDGPQATDIALSPRGGWKMPSDAYGDLWQI